MHIQAPIPQDAAENDMAWRGLSADVGWEASDKGVIRCHAVLNRRSDIFQAVEGLNLRDIVCEGRNENAFALLQKASRIRHVGVRLPRHFGPEQLYLTAQRQPGGTLIGVFCAMEARFDEVLRGRADLLSQVSLARSREANYRHESETMLLGLRLLLGEATTVEKLESLGRLLADTIKSSSSVLLCIGRDGAPRAMGVAELSASGRSAIRALWLEQNAPVCVYGERSPHLRPLQAMLDVVGGEVALISLPVASESIVLVCGAGRAGSFAPDDVDFASRFTLILRQAAVLKEEQDKLVQSAKLSILGQMSAGLAHELRQPLNTISMAAQNLGMMADSDRLSKEAVKAKVARMLGQVARADQIIDRVRRFSRKSTGAFAQADLAILAQGVRILSEHALLTSRVGLEVQVPHGLTAICDVLQIEQLVANLVRNAIDALSGIGSAGATMRGIVQIRGWQTENETVLRVEDNGPGFPTHVLDRPLEAFFTTKDADAGTGLGLSICHTIAREHAGTLTFGNNPEGGAYVELRLPERSA